MKSRVRNFKRFSLDVGDVENAKKAVIDELLEFGKRALKHVVNFKFGGTRDDLVGHQAAEL